MAWTVLLFCFCCCCFLTQFMIWSACFPFLTQKYKNDQILKYTDASEPPPSPSPRPTKIIKTILERWWSGERYRTTVLQTLTRKAKTPVTPIQGKQRACTMTITRTKKLKRDHLTDTHTRKATFAKGVNKIDLKHSLPQPLPRANTHMHTNINPSPTKKKNILTQETAVAAYALSEWRVAGIPKRKNPIMRMKYICPDPLT